MRLTKTPQPGRGRGKIAVGEVPAGIRYFHRRNWIAAIAGLSGLAGQQAEKPECASDTVDQPLAMSLFEAALL